MDQDQKWIKIKSWGLGKKWIKIKSWGLGKKFG